MDVDLPLLGMTEAVPSVLSEAHWAAFARQGFLDLGPIVLTEEADWLRRCADGLVGAELVALLSTEGARPFLELMHHPLLHEVCFRVYGLGAPVMLFSGELSGSSPTPGAWRQDASRLVDFDRDEVVTVIVSLGEAADRHATAEVVPSSHRMGLRDASDGHVSPSAITREALEHRFVRVRIESGSALLLHKWMIHRPGAADDRHGSRSVTFVFVDGRARSTITGYPQLPMVLGETRSDPYPCVSRLEGDRAHLRRHLGQLSGR